MGTRHVIALGSTALLCLAPLVLAQTPARPNFTGTWVMDVAKSDLGEAPPPKSHVLTIVHKEPNVTVDRVVDERKDSAAFRTDGVETESDSGCCGRVKTTGRWDGNALLRRIVNEKLIQNDTWTLSADGKVLTIIRKVDQEMGSSQWRLVFAKKE